MSTDFYKDGGAPEFPNPKPTPRPILQPRVSDCSKSERKDGKHSWKFDGDDPYVECCYCGQYQDAISGRVIKPVTPSPTPQDERKREMNECGQDVTALNQAKKFHQPVIDTMHAMGFGLMLDGKTFYRYGYEINPHAHVHFSMNAAYIVHDYAKKAHEDGYREALDQLKVKFDEHAQSIGLWGMDGLVLDTLAVHGDLSFEQKVERDAMVTERRALAVLYGAIAELNAKGDKPDE